MKVYPDVDFYILTPEIIGKELAKIFRNTQKKHTTYRKAK